MGAKIRPIVLSCWNTHRIRSRRIVIGEVPFLTLFGVRKWDVPSKAKLGSSGPDGYCENYGTEYARVYEVLRTEGGSSNGEGSG